MDLGDILSNYTYIFLLILFRYTGLFLMAPVIGSRAIPRRVKMGLILFLTVVSLPVVTNSPLSIVMPARGLAVLIDMFREFTIGYTIGFIAYLPFAAIQLAGRFIDMRMGFAIVNVTDPIHGSTMPMTGQFKNILATLLFLGMNGHYLLLRALHKSFNWIPLAGVSFNNFTFNYIFRTTGNLFIMALKIALPVMITLFVADIILGFLARTIPQINIFIVGLPLKIITGFILLLLSIHFTIYFFQELFMGVYEEILEILRMAGSGG